jgi:hypothetical protein
MRGRQIRARRAPPGVREAPRCGMDLTDFLLARIAEDQAYCRVKISLEGEPSTTRPKDADLTEFLQKLIDMCGGHPDAEVMIEMVKAGMWSPTDPTRVLAAADALRQVVEHRRGTADGDTIILRMLAVPYAAHPHYREEWRP